MKVVSTKLTDDEYQALLERAREEGVSVADFVRRAILATLNLPVSARPEAGDRLSALEKRVDDLERAVNEIKEVISKIPGAQVITQDTTAAERGSKKKAWNILEEQKIVCVSTMAKARDPHKVIDVLKGNGAIVLSSEGDRCAVYPDTWASFVESLAKMSSPDEREVAGKLKGKAKQLFRMLRAAGAVYYDSKARRWVVDASAVEEAVRAPGPASAGGEAAGAGGRVLRIPVEEAGDPERYVAEMERRGWLCNEAARQVICVWRETLEQAVVDLNSAGAGARDMERVLAGDTAKLEVAKAAHEAGLLWYSSQEKRWKATL